MAISPELRRGVKRLPAVADRLHMVGAAGLGVSDLKSIPAATLTLLTILEIYLKLVRFQPSLDIINARRKDPL